MKIDMKIIRPWICSCSLILIMNFWTSWTNCNVVNPLEIFDWNSIGFTSIVSKVLSNNIWCLVLIHLSEDITQNLRIRKTLACERLMTSFSTLTIKNFPSWFETLQKSHRIVRLLNFSDMSNICFQVRFSYVFWWNVYCLSNSFPWVQMLSMSNTETFTKWENVCQCLASHLLENGPTSFAIGHSLCSRMNVI